MSARDSLWKFLRRKLRRDVEGPFTVELDFDGQHHVWSWMYAEAGTIRLRLETGSAPQLAWMQEMERIEQEVFPDARPRSEVVVPCTCYEAGRNPECPIHGSFAGRPE